MPILEAQACKGYSESLDHEAPGFGVRIVVIEPAATRASYEASTIASDTPLAAYDANRANYLVAYERAMAVADTAESVAETIVRAAGDRSGKAAQQVAFARRFVPRALFDKILRSQFGLA
jgi:short-subunit dehydrogenase